MNNLDMSGYMYIIIWYNIVHLSAVGNHLKGTDRVGHDKRTYTGPVNPAADKEVLCAPYVHSSH